MRFGNVSSPILVALGASALIGCATQSPDVPVPATEYAEAFTAARDVLHSYRFTLDRVDARAGVLTTHASGSAGFFTPWNRQESTFGQEWENTIHDQQRRVEIVFAIAPTPESNQGATGPDVRSDQAREHTSDLLEAPRDTNAHVLVVVERIYQFGWRPNTKSTALMSLTEDTQPDIPSRVVVDIADDPRLAGRIASEIRALIAKRANAKLQAAAPEPAQAPVKEQVQEPMPHPVQQPVEQQIERSTEQPIQQPPLQQPQEPVPAQKVVE